MKKKTYELIVGIHPAATVQIVAGIGIASTAINEVCALFVKPDAKIEK